MSLRIKLGVLIAAIVALTLVAAWTVSRRVMQPFAREVHERYLDEVLYVADQIESGTSPSELSRSLKLDIRVFAEPPKGLTRPGGRREMRCEVTDRGGRTLTHCRGRRAPVMVGTRAGYVVVRRDLDVAAPERRLGELLLFVAVVVIVFSALTAAIVTKPLEATKRAMERVARGELTHRLPVAGGKELADAARAFNAMADRVDTLLRTERELMAGISHELRTPLARLRLQLELLRDLGTVPEKRIGAMEVDLEEIDHLIGEVLESSRLSLGDRMLERQSIELEELVREAVAKNALANHTVEVFADAPRVILGDRARLLRAIGNVLQNAGKYAPEGTEVRVEVRGAEVSILDRGPGVPESELEKLFEPFYRGTRAAANTAGLGLGLMIARQVATLHGGTIEARNRDGGGLEVVLRLPEVSEI